MKKESSSEIFMERLADAQQELRHFVAAALAARPDDVMDVVQNTNYALIRHAGEYSVEKPFLPWSISFAKNQIRAYRKKSAQEKLVFDDALLDQYEKSAFDGEEESATASLQLKSLLTCLEKLPERQRSLVDLHYLKGRALTRIAADEHKPESTINMTVFRARQALYDCIKRLCRLQNAPEEPPTGPRDSFAETLVHVIDSPRPDSSEVIDLLAALRGKPGAMDVYAEQVKIHCLLTECAEIQNASKGPGARRRVWLSAIRVPPILKGLAAAAALALLVGGGTVWISRLPRAGSLERPAAETVRAVPGSRAESAPTAIRVGIRSPAGGPLPVRTAAEQQEVVAAVSAAGGRAPVPVPDAAKEPSAVPRQAPVAAVAGFQRKEKGETMRITTTKTAAVASALAAVALGAGTARAQSGSVAINTSPDRNGRWCAVTTNAVSLAWDWPEGAEAADLTVTGKEKTLLAKTIGAVSASTTVVWRAFDTAIPKAEDEGVYAATLAFYGLSGSPTGQVLSAELVVTRSAFGRVPVMPDAEKDIWKKIYSKTALLPYDNRWLESTNAVSFARLCVSNAMGACSSAAKPGVEGYEEGYFSNGTRFLATVLFDDNLETSLSAWIWKEPRGTIITFNP